jgi:hypothetical protein
LHFEFYDILQKLETASSARDAEAFARNLKSIGGLPELPKRDRFVLDAHVLGLAIDVNYWTNPYIMHEAGEQQLDIKLGNVYERISLFILGRNSVIPTKIVVGGGISVKESLFQQLKEESEAMIIYFGYLQDQAKLHRYLATDQGFERFELATCFDLFLLSPGRNVFADPKNISTRALLDRVTQKMRADWATLSDSPSPPVALLGKNYCFCLGDPCESPPSMKIEKPKNGDRPFSKGRSPLNGFMDLEWALVSKFTSAGIVWGATDFGAESGDIMHFDLRAKYNQLKIDVAKHIADLFS